MSLGRKIILKTSGFIFESPDFSIDFKINYSKDKDNNSAKIEIFNLSKETIKNIIKDNQIFLEAGYEDDKTGLIFVGYIKEKEVKWDTIDKRLILICGDNTNEWQKQIYSKTWETKTKASQIINDIINNLYYQKADLDLKNDVEYRR